MPCFLTWYQNQTLLPSQKSFLWHEQTENHCNTLAQPHYNPDTLLFAISILAATAIAFLVQSHPGQPSKSDACTQVNMVCHFLCFVIHHLTWKGTFTESSTSAMPYFSWGASGVQCKVYTLTSAWLQNVWKQGESLSVWGEQWFSVFSSQMWQLFTGPETRRILLTDLNCIKI